MNRPNLVLMILMAASTVAHAEGNKRKAATPPLEERRSPPPAPAPKGPDYRASYDAATKDLQETDSLLQQRQYQQALAQSKTVLQNIQSVLGIQPRTPKIIQIDQNIFGDELLTKSFDELPTQTRITISNVVQSQMQAQYLNLLNAAKRASIQYVKASYQQRVESTKDLDKRDIEYFRKLVLDAHDVKIFIQDSRSRGLFIAFDSEFADYISQYEFNKELQQFALSIPQLGYTEDSFEKALIDHRAAQRADHIAQLPKPTPPEKPKPSTGPFMGTFSSASIDLSSRPGIAVITDPTYNGAPLSKESLTHKYRRRQEDGDFQTLVCAGFGYTSSAMVNGTRFVAYENTVTEVMHLKTYGYTYAADNSFSDEGTPIQELYCKN
jgi:hypothetical protein